MKWSRFLIHARLATALLFINAVSHAQSCENLQGQWMNDLGSVLEIESIATDGMINGKYLSSTGVDGKEFPLLGWVNNYQSRSDAVPSIAFSVRWEGYESITSWTGSCDVDEEGPFILTLWHLVRPEQEFSWERIIANSSTFRPVPK